MCFCTEGCKTERKNHENSGITRVALRTRQWSGQGRTGQDEMGEWLPTVPHHNSIRMIVQQSKKHVRNRLSANHIRRQRWGSQDAIWTSSEEREVFQCVRWCKVRRVVRGGICQSVLRTFSHIFGQDGIDAFVISCIETVSHGLGKRE